MVRTRFSLFAVAIALAACGPKTSEVLDEYRGRYRALETDLAALAPLLPPRGSVAPGAKSGALDPAPLFDVAAETFNTEFIAEACLQDPYVKVEFDLMLAGTQGRVRKWSGPNNPLSSSVLDGGVQDGFREDLEAGLSMRYVVVYRTTAYTAPVALDASRFRAGSARLEAFLIDLERKKLVLGLTVDATTADQVEYVYQRSADDPKYALEGWARSSLWENARAGLAKALAAATNGTFRLK